MGSKPRGSRGIIPWQNQQKQQGQQREQWQKGQQGKGLQVGCSALRGCIKWEAVRGNGGVMYGEPDESSSLEAVCPCRGHGPSREGHGARDRLQEHSLAHRARLGTQEERPRGSGEGARCACR